MVSSTVYPGLERKPGVQNWVDRVGGLPSYIERIAKHLVYEKGMTISHAIATAVNAVKKMCATGDLNWPGLQSVNLGSRAEACAAVASWEAKKAAAHGLSSSAMSDTEFIHRLFGRGAIMLDGVYAETLDDAPEIVSALTAGGAPVKPPKSWFDNPSLEELTPLTIVADGRVYGHIASWTTEHIGLPGNVRPPRSKSRYAFFRTGVVATAEGTDIEVGQITSVGGHAGIEADASSTVKHYDDTASAFADVTIGEDAFGPWVAGALRPTVTEEQIRAVRASAPSGDWRWINGNLELVAICQVNVPGFPIARGMAAGGEWLALVAAGAAPLYQLRQEQSVLRSLEQLAERMGALEARVASGRDVEPVKETDRRAGIEHRARRASLDARVARIQR